MVYIGIISENNSEKFKLIRGAYGIGAWEFFIFRLKNHLFFIFWNGCFVGLGIYLFLIYEKIINN